MNNTTLRKSYATNTGAIVAIFVRLLDDKSNDIKRLIINYSFREELPPQKVLLSIHSTVTLKIY